MKPFYIILFAAIFFLGFSLYAYSQNSKYKKDNKFTLAFYNVENLFDTINNPQKKDEEFLPESDKKWTTKRYWQKINNLSKVISSINLNGLPEIVGLCEVENKSVLQDLVNSELLKPGDYQIIHEESDDIRGIDVALIFRKEKFTYISHEVHKVKFTKDPDYTTRDILYVKGKLNNNEILHVFVNHWSSRREGVEETEIKRIDAAKVLREKVDNLLKKDKNAKIFIMGDFNDEPTNNSLNIVLNATNNQRTTNFLELYNLMYDKHLNKVGSYNHRGEWNMIDNLIISQSLLKSKIGYVVSTDGGQVFKERWMMFDNKKTGQLTPSKSYGGPQYYGGYSDHFPVFVTLKNN
ncbi:MAG: hypothetical protein JXR51_12815 [Bacteroidales bacterium]|nr:hypothetical protein [Bacteroidales bacterium]MBN2758052.1 hypothetical protein [Bacteroidales bacterium]